MQYFEPKHSNYIVPQNSEESIYITNEGKILISNSLYESILGKWNYNLEKGTQSLEKYTIIHSNAEITYDELCLINIAISVFRFKYYYIILLSDGSLVYVVDSMDSILSVQKLYLFEFNKFISSISIDYICKFFDKILVYSGTRLYLVNESLTKENLLNIEIYENVIGYLTKYKTLLILYNDLRVECIVPAPYVLKTLRETGETGEPGEPGDCSDLAVVESVIIPKINTDLLTGISIENTCFFVMYALKIKCYTINGKTNSFINRIIDLPNISHLDYMSCMRICMLSTGTLLSENKYKVEYCHNVLRYFSYDMHLICIHCDRTVSMIKYTYYVNVGGSITSIDYKLQLFFTNSDNFDMVNDISQIFYLDESKVSKDLVLFYLSVNNTLKCLNIVSLVFVSLDEYIMVPSNLMNINLIEYDPANYI